MFAVMSSISGRPKAFETILVGGLIAGILDGLDAAIYYDLVSGVAPARLFRGVASGLLGPAALSGGTPTAVLGLALHFTIAIGAAAVFYAGCRLIPKLVERPWIYGPAYGLVV